MDATQRYFFSQCNILQTQKHGFFVKPDFCPNNKPKIFKSSQIFQLNSEYLVVF